MSAVGIIIVIVVVLFLVRFGVRRHLQRRRQQIIDRLRGNNTCPSEDCNVAEELNNGIKKIDEQLAAKPAKKKPAKKKSAKKKTTKKKTTKKA